MSVDKTVGLETNRKDKAFIGPGPGAGGCGPGPRPRAGALPDSRPNSSITM